jgi:hypothetical protein
MTGRFRGPPEFAKGWVLKHLWAVQSSVGFITSRRDDAREGDWIMAKKKIGQVITRPGRTVNHPDVVIPIPEDL